MDDQTTQITQPTQPVSRPKQPSNFKLDIFIIVLGIIVALCFPFFTIFTFSGLNSQRYKFWIFLVVVVLWMTLNYFLGRAIVRLQYAKYPDYARRALRLLILIQGIIICADALIFFIKDPINLFSTLMATGLSCLPTLLIGFIPAYVAIGRHSQETSQRLTTPEQKQSFIQHNLPKSAYTPPNIVAVVLSGLLTIAALFNPPAGMAFLQFIIVGAVVVVPWLFCNYHCGLVAAKMEYDTIVSTQTARTAYIKIIVFQLISIALTIIVVALLTGSLSPKFCFDSCQRVNLFSFLPWYLVISTLGFIPAYVAIHRYTNWVKLYHIPKPAKHSQSRTASPSTAPSTAPNVLDKYRQFFEDYTSKFDMSEWAIKYKHDHTLRVAKLCRTIAESLQMSPADAELAELIGLFHDLGRFKQWTKYQTFDDTQTLDHAHLSVQVLQDHHVLDGWPEEKLVLAAVENHNKFKIDPTIQDERIIKFCQIVRDADKLDIFRSVLDGKIPYKRLESHDQQYNQAVIDSIKNHQPIDRSICQNDTDKSLNKFGLFFDINFDYTKDCIRNEKIIQNLTNIYIRHNPDKADLFHQLEQYVLEVY